MSDIFNEQNMINSLSAVIPEGETLEAGIHAAANETYIKRVFTKCIPSPEGDYLLPQPNGLSVQVEKIKYSTHDVYVGVTENYFVLTECERYKHLYKFDMVDNSPYAVELHEKLAPEDIKCVFAFSDIQEAVVKKGIMGSLKCNITMKDGSYLKLIFPKLGGLGKGMPHHSEYRDKICNKLAEIG